MPSAATLAAQKQINTPCGLFCGGGLDKIHSSSPSSLGLANISTLPVHYSAYLWGKVSHLPLWRGFMQVVSNDILFSISHMTCLPFYKCTTIKSNNHKYCITIFGTGNTYIKSMYMLRNVRSALIFKSSLDSCAIGRRRL